MKIFSSLPVQRLVFYMLSVLLLPIVVAYIYTQSLITNAHDTFQEFQRSELQIQQKIGQQKQNKAIIHKYAHKDPLFLHKNIESLPFLQTEIQALKKQLGVSCTPDDVALQRRLQTLLQTDNKCTFLETSTENGSFYKQIIETQNKAIEIDNADLETILQIIETEDETQKEKPHLLVLEARLDRKKNLLSDSWSLFLKILRREYSL